MIDNISRNSGPGYTDRLEPGVGPCIILFLEEINVSTLAFSSFAFQLLIFYLCVMKVYCSLNSQPTQPKKFSHIHNPI